MSIDEAATPGAPAADDGSAMPGGRDAAGAGDKAAAPSHVAGDAAPMRVLIVDDEETDAAVLAYELGRRLVQVQTRWAEGGDRMFAEIEAWQPDIVLTDAHMPRFDLLDALANLRARWPLLPVVVVSGLVGDEVAAQLIKAGANDFVAKPGGARLALVVERELRDACGRAEKAALQAQLQRQQAMFERVLEHLPVGVWLLDAAGTIVRGNPAGTAIWDGARHTGIEGYGVYRGWWADSGRAIEAHEWAAARAIEKGQTSIDERIEIETFAGRRKVILNSAVPLLDADGTLQGAFIVNQDITGLHRTEQRLRRAERTLRGLSQRLLDAQEQERRWIAQELHDDIGQAIAAMRLHLARIAEHSGPGRAAALAAEALASSEQLGQRLRQIC
ncbi:MAG: response regulator, partial [Burkholderiaceae bacterium]